MKVTLSLRFEVFFLWILTSTCIAQDFTFIKFSHSEGLRHSQVLDISQDINGNLWLGTATRSIYRFDGKDFFEYKIDLPNYTGTLYTFNVTTDSRNRVWIFSNLGVLCFNGKTARVIPTNGDLSIGSNSKLISDRLDRIWVIDEKNQLFQITNDTLKQRDDITESVGSKVMGYFENEDAFACFYSESGKVIEIGRDGKGEIKQGPWGEISNVQYVHKFGQVYWVAANNKIIKLSNGSSREEIDVPGREGTIKQFTVDRDGVIWLIAGNKLLTVGKDKKVNRVSGSPSLVENDVICLFKDNDGGVWVSVDLLGIVKYKKLAWTKISETQGLDITAILELPDSKLIFGTYMNGVLGLEHSPLVGKPITALMPGRNGKIIAGTLKHGLFEISGKSVKKILPANAEPLDVHGLLVCGDSIIAGTSKGIFVVSPNGIRNYTRKDGSFAMSSPVRVNDTIYFAGAIAGLMKLSGNNILSVGPDFLKKSTIYNIRKVGRSYVVTGEFSTVFWLDQNFNFVKSVDLKKAVSNVLLFEVIDDTHWLVGSNDGLFKINVDNDSIQSVRKYGRLDGYFEEELYVGASIIRRNGNILIGTVKGAYSLDPLNEEREVVVPRTYITSIDFHSTNSIDSVDGYFQLPRNLSLNHNENTITFGFASSSLANPSNIEYQCKLEGVENDWSSIGSSRKITYTNLAPGKYSFHVQAINESKVLGNVASCSFNVLPAFWQTEWFYFLIGLALFALVFAVILVTTNYRVRQHKLKEKVRLDESSKIKKQMSMDFHDEMGNKLAGILAQASHLKFRHKGTELESTFDYFERNAFAIFHGTKDFIWTIDVASNNLREVISYIRDFGFNYFERNGINFHVEDNLFHPDLDFTLPDGYNRQIILIFKEAMTNALKHSNCRNVYLKVEIRKPHVFISFMDDGHWPANMVAGFGIKNMQARAARIHAIFSCSVVNDLTTIQLTLDLIR